MAYTFDPNTLCETMMKFYTSQRMDNVDGKWVGRKREINGKIVEDSALCCYILNEGSSRSSKTYDFWHFMFWLCGLEYYRKNPLNIFVYRTTLKACRETAYDTDFVNCMKIIGHYSPKNARNEGQAPEYNLFGSIIKFRGLENGVEQGASDVIFFNEALDNQDPKIVDELLLRCTKLAVFDWNPKLTYHFLFDWEGRERTLFTKTTILDNKHRPEAVLERLMSYSPWDFKDFDFEKKVWKVSESERSINEKNLKYNTINRRMFLVYFMGERCPEEGIIFPNVEYVPEFPDDCEETTFGLDFGYTTDSSVLVQVGKRGMDLFIQYHTYSPCETAMHLYYMVQPILDAYQEKQKEKYGKLDVPALNIVCDSSDKYKDEAFVEMLNLYKYKDAKNYDFYKTSKKEIVLGISLMKMFRLHVVWRDNNEIFKKARMEFENYTNDKVNGMYINRPIDKFNHGIDATRYVCVEKYLHLVNR